MPINKKTYTVTFTTIAVVVLVAIFFLKTNQNYTKNKKGAPANTYDPIVIKWATLFDPSVLSLKERYAELNWFQKTALSLRNITLNSVGEDIETSFWESQYLARAFHEITGIKVRHDVIGEGDVVDRLMEQLEHGQHHYDIYVTDADLIGTHLRSRKIVVLSDYISKEGRPFTNPKLDLQDFLNLKCGQDYEGNQLQIPDYQFALVYWFRHDWFSDPQVKTDFLEKYGYDLGVPLNWSAYEDIAAFFTGRKMKNPNDSEVIAFGHADYALPGPWLGWRFSDAFFSLAGMGDKGLPNGIPVDEWGIRVENKIPVGASVARGGAINGPAAVYGLQKWLELLDKYAPPEAVNLDWLALGAVPARGDIAQTWYWTQIYASLNPLYNKVGSPVCDRQGNPVWRIAPMPRGRYWEDGMKIGYVDSGSWTIPKDTVGDKRHAAWLWAQFCLSKTVAVKKFLAGATPVRRSTLFSRSATDSQHKFGGMIELLRSPLMKKFSDSGPNVPHYPRMSALWWQNIAMVIQNEKTPQEALDNLSKQFDAVMESLEQEAYSPKLNSEDSIEYWLSQPGSPKPKKPKKAEPKTIPYEKLLQQWKMSES